MTVHSVAMPGPDLARARTAAAIAFGAGAVACIVGLLTEPAQLLRSWLLAFVFWSSLPLGALALLMIHGLTGGRWGTAVRGVLTACARTLPLIALAFVPILFDLGLLYPWARPGAAASSEHLRHLEPYLNVPFWVARAFAALAFWLLLAFLLGRSRGGTGVAAVGLIIHVLVVTVTSVDWVMSLEEHWSSMAFGVKTLAGQMIAALSIALLALAAVSRHPQVRHIVDEKASHDLGNLLLALVMLWSYVAFSEWMIVWSGNLPPEIRWYAERSSPGWLAVGFALIVLHFFVPFAFLLSRRFKRSAWAMGWIAAWLLVMRLVDHFWILVPSTHTHGATPHWLDFAAPCALGGLWGLVALTLLARRPVVPEETP